MLLLGAVFVYSGGNNIGAIHSISFKDSFLFLVFLRQGRDLHSLAILELTHRGLPYSASCALGLKVCAWHIFYLNYMCMCLWGCECLSSEEGIRLSDTGVTSGCGPSSGLLQKLHTPLTTEPSSQAYTPNHWAIFPVLCVFFFFSFLQQRSCHSL